MAYQLFLLQSIKLTVLVLQILPLGVIGQLPQPNVTLGKDGICDIFFLALESCEKICFL